jgi:hypothetical protein
LTATWPPKEPLVPGKGFPGLRVGTALADVIACLGDPAGIHADGRILSWTERGVLVRLDGDERVESLTLGAAFVPGGLEWPEVILPEGLSWQSLLPDVRDALGDPVDFATGEVVPGSGRRHHIVQYEGLRITFDDQGRLTSVSVP